jgi:hypothetical protein
VGLKKPDHLKLKISFPTKGYEANSAHEKSTLRCSFRTGRANCESEYTVAIKFPGDFGSKTVI